MFIIFGTSHRKKVLGQSPRTCPRCRRDTVHTIERRQSWFNLFFIPIFPITKSTYVARCNLCGQEMAVTGQGQPSTISPSPVVAESSRQAATKKCPACAEAIQLDAQVCRYCGHHLGEKEHQAAQVALQEQAAQMALIAQRDGLRRKRGFQLGCGWTLAVIGGLVALFCILALITGPAGDITASQHVTSFLIVLAIVGLPPLGLGIFLVLRGRKTKTEIDSLK